MDRPAEQSGLRLFQRQVAVTEGSISKTVTRLTVACSCSGARRGPARATRAENLKSYALVVRQGGKWTGKYAAHRRSQARNAMRDCRSAVPAWVMPIYPIAETLNVEKNMFDVVIIDEASQAGIEATFLLYLAPKIVVVGDDKQVSPSGVGQDRQQLIDLGHQFLSGFDDLHVENPQTSSTKHACVLRMSSPSVSTFGAFPRSSGSRTASPTNRTTSRSSRCVSTAGTDSNPSARCTSRMATPTGHPPTW